MVSGSRRQSLMDPGWCTTIKNRGIRIAVIYTTYLPLPTNSWYKTYISPFQAEIGPTLQSCASPGPLLRSQHRPGYFRGDDEAARLRRADSLPAEINWRAGETSLVLSACNDVDISKSPA
jgi:hypothetical protein